MSRFISISLLLALACTAATSARADDDARAPADPRTALGISLVSTVGAAGLLYAGVRENVGAFQLLGVTGLLLGPSAGHWYAHQRPVRGLAVRSMGAVIVGAGLIASATECPQDLFASTPAPPCERSSLGPGMMIAGAAIVAIGAIDDIVTAPGAARRWNRHLADIAIAPVVAPGQVGFAVAGRF